MPKKRKPQTAPRIVEEVGDLDDESINEDEAFNSDDEKKYGAFFLANDEMSEETGDDDDIASDDDGSSEGDGGQYMLDLLSKIGSDELSETKIKVHETVAHAKESEFSSAVVKKGKLTLDNLMNDIQDTDGFTAVYKAAKQVAQGKAISPPVSKVVSRRVERKLHYEDQSKDVSQWLETVQQNRQAETLDFRPKDRLHITKEVMVDKFVPTTDFEKQLNAALEEAGQQDEKAILAAEEKALQDDLGANHITLEEYKKRRGQLAKMRALMFYHEQKRHHINKIKSKTYRRIRKRQRLRQKEAELSTQVQEDPDLERELQEKEEIERMKERMTLAHKNTSNWAKRVIRRGKNVDLETRRALSAQLQRGEDLLKKMRTTKQGDDDDDSDEDLLESARKVLEDANNDEVILGKGLFKLSFMRKGAERQRQKAKEEARQLLMELEANERAAARDSDDVASSDEDEPTKKKTRPASKEVMKSVLGEGSMMVNSLKVGGISTETTVMGGIDLALDLPKGNLSEHRAEMQVTTEELADDSNKEQKPPKQRAQAKSQHTKTQQEDEETNPWMMKDEAEPSTKESTSKSSKKKSLPKVIDVDSAADVLNTDAVPKAVETTDETQGTSSRKLVTLTQEELLRRAFATQSEQEADNEFEQEKKKVMDREDPTRKRKQEEATFASGWGSWTGKGAVAKPPKKLPKHLQPPESKLPKRQRTDDKKPHVILSQKRLKKTADTYMLSEIPYPYTSREEYERAMLGSLGPEFNVTSSHKALTRPEILARQGKIIQPLSKKAKVKRPAAKF